MDNCFGFIDGTVRPISKPGQNQRVVYNGRKRVHGVKFQSVALPNGIIGNMYGPIGKGNRILNYPSVKDLNFFNLNVLNLSFFFFIEGRRHDAAMLTDSNLL